MMKVYPFNAYGTEILNSDGVPSVFYKILPLTTYIEILGYGSFESFVFVEGVHQHKSKYNLVTISCNINATAIAIRILGENQIFQVNGFFIAYNTTNAISNVENRLTSVESALTNVQSRLSFIESEFGIS